LIHTTTGIIPVELDDIMLEDASLDDIALEDAVELDMVDPPPSPLPPPPVAAEELFVLLPSGSFPPLPSSRSSP
jgi:hypothetical protein